MFITGTKKIIYQGDNDTPYMYFDNHGIKDDNRSVKEDNHGMKDHNHSIKDHNHCM